MGVPRSIRSQAIHNCAEENINAKGKAKVSKLQR
jgi:hypothetical protein